MEREASTEQNVPQAAKARPSRLPALAALVLAASHALAQDFAIEPIGFISLTGTSTDGNFAVSGTMMPAGGPAMSGGDFAISGEFLNVAPANLFLPEELIVNGSFENTAGTFVRDGNGLMSLPAGSSAVPGWTTTSAELAWVDNANPFGAGTPFGTHSFDLTGYHDGRPYGGVAQTIPTRPGQRYRFSLSLGSNADFPNAGGPKAVSVCAGSAGVAFTMTPTNATGNQWETFRFDFTANGAATEIKILGLIASGVYLGLDNVSVVAVDSVPSATELVVNGGFESACTFVPDGSGVMALLPDSTVIPGWSTTTAELVWGMNGNAFGPRSPYGSLFLDLTGYHDAPPYAGITQTLATTPNQNYQLSFSLGAHQDNSTYRGPMTMAVTAGSASNSFTFTPTGTGSQWGTFMMDFTAASASTPLTFLGTGSAGGAYLGLDNVSVIVASEAGLRLAPATIVGAELQFGFPTSPGQSYVVESRADFATGEWTIVPNAVITGGGATRQVTIPDAFQQPKQFYRVKRLR